MSSGTANAIYGKRLLTSDLRDSKFADEIDSFRNSKAGNMNSGSRRQVQQLQKRQREQLRLPQEKLQQASAPKGQRHNAFSAFRSVQRQTAPLPAQSAAVSSEPQYPSENRFELYYSRSCAASRTKAQQLLQALESYFVDDYIRDHIVAVDFDDERNVGPVHTTIVNSPRYVAVIQEDCILYDKFGGFLLMPEHNIFKVMKNYCQSFMPQQDSAAGDSQLYAQQRHPPAEKQIADVRQPETERAQKVVAMPEDADSVPMPPRGLLGVSMLAKQVGADINSPTATVKLDGRVPKRTNALLTAETKDDMNRIPQANIASIYGKTSSVTLGYGENTDLIKNDFVTDHNTKNTLDRDISVPQQKTAGRSRGKAVADANVNWQRQYSQEQLQKQKAEQMVQTPTATGGQRSEKNYQPQHLQGLPPATNSSSVRSRQRMAPAPQSNASLATEDQMGTIRQIKVKK